VIIIWSQNTKQINQLFTSSQDISNKKISKEKIKNLPEPIQRYFNCVLGTKETHISSVRLKHGGKFRLKKKWKDITGEEYFTTQTPGFFWIGRLPLFKGLDSYINGKGNLRIKFLSFLKIIDSKGEKINQAELLRWLGEAPLFPIALLPNKNLQWEAINDQSAKVSFTDKGLTVTGKFFVNDKGEITTFTAKRYMEKILEKWTGHYEDYQLIDGYKIPHKIEVAWNLEDGNFSYAKFIIDLIEFNNPKPFEK
jgi:hypothetical protein